MEQGLQVMAHIPSISDSHANGGEQAVTFSILLSMNGELAGDPLACGEADIFNISEVDCDMVPCPPPNLYQSIKSSLSGV